MTIGISVKRQLKAQRDKLSGILRYAADKPDWNVVILEQGKSTPDHLDALIMLYTLASKFPQRKPTVFIDHPNSAIGRSPNILIDNHAIGVAAAKLFLQRGIPNLAAVRYTNPSETHHINARIEAFCATATAAGITADIYTPSSIAENDFLCASTAFRRWLRELPKPCGIFCYFDQQTRDVLDSCRMEHLSIPHQVALIGVDNDIDLCETTIPSLSSIQPDFEAGGYLAAKTLADLLAHRKVCKRQTYGILRVVERDSTRPLNAGGRIVSKALQLIKSSDGKLTVAGIARELNVSTSLLKIRFKEIVGHSPKEEIDLSRLAKIKNRLRDPSLSVAEIAELCHFAHPENLHLFFHRHTGLTPGEWRRQGVRS